MGTVVAYWNSKNAKNTLKKGFEITSHIDNHRNNESNSIIKLEKIGPDRAKTKIDSKPVIYLVENQVIASIRSPFMW